MVYDDESSGCNIARNKLVFNNQLLLVSKSIFFLLLVNSYF